MTGLLILLSLTGACGYRLYSSSGLGSPQIGRVYVDVFANNTPVANIETEFRNAFIDQLIKGRRFKVVDSESMADAVLKGSIKNLVFSPLAYRGDTNTAVEKRITGLFSLTLEAKGKPAPLWHEENFTLWEDYALDTTSLQAGQVSQQNALTKLAGDVAERAYLLMISDF